MSQVLTSQKAGPRKRAHHQSEVNEARTHVKVEELFVGQHKRANLCHSWKGSSTAVNMGAGPRKLPLNLSLLMSTPCSFQEPAVVDQSRLGVRNPKFATGLHNITG